MILFGMPLVMMLLFGFAISTDIKNVRAVVVTSSMDDATRTAARRLAASEYFEIVATASTPTEAEHLIRDQKADMAVVFTPHYADHKYDRTAGMQIIVDASSPNTAMQQASYASQVMAAATGSPVNLKMLYNPQMLSSYNFVPGIMGVILMLICAMMTSVSIVREKERGTMEVLLVSPMRPLWIIIAKAVPYLMLSLAILVGILLLAAFVLNVPVAGGIGWLLLVSLLYILLALSLGLLISVVANTQLVAVLTSAVLLLMPSMLLSGMIFPVESMPKILQYISLIIPARWFISAVRKLMIMGVGVEAVAKEIVILTGMTVLLLALALKNFKVRL